MKEIDLKKLLIPIVLRHAEEQTFASASLFLTIPDFIPIFHWRDSSMELLIRALVELSISFGQEEMPIRLAASRRAHMADLEELLELRPYCWVQLGVEVRSCIDVIDAVRKLPESFGFGGGEEWQAGPGRLIISYFHGMDSAPVFFLALHKRRAEHQYSLVIPIMSPEIRA
jgi:hypothetical protein